MDGKKYIIDTSKLTSEENTKIIDFINNGPYDTSIKDVINKLDLINISVSNSPPATKEGSAAPDSSPTSTTPLAACSNNNTMLIALDTISKLMATGRELYYQMLHDLHSDVLNNPLAIDPKYVNAKYELAITGAELSPQLAEMHKTTLIWNIVRNIPELVLIAAEIYQPSSYLHINMMLNVALQRATNLYELAIALDSVSQTNTYAAINRAISDGDSNAEFIIKAYMLDSGKASVDKLYDEYAGRLTSFIISECVYLLFDNAPSPILDDLLRYSVSYIRHLKNIDYILDDTPEELQIRETIQKLYDIKRAIYQKLIIFDLMSYKFIDQYYNPVQMYEIDFSYYITLRFKAFINNIVSIPYPLANDESIKSYISCLYNIIDIATGEQLNPIDKLIRCIDDYHEYYQHPNIPTKEELCAGVKPIICLFEPAKGDRAVVNYSAMLDHMTRYTGVLFSDTVLPRDFARYERDAHEINFIYQLAKIYRHVCYTKCNKTKINRLIDTRLPELAAIHKYGVEYIEEFIPNQSPPNLQTGFIQKPLDSLDTKLLVFILTRLKIYHFLRFINRNTKIEVVRSYEVCAALMMYRQCMIYEFEPICRIIMNMPLLPHQFYHVLANSASVLITDVYVDTVGKYYSKIETFDQYVVSDLIGENYMQLNNGIVVPRLLAHSRLSNNALNLVWLFITDNRVAGQKRVRYVTSYLLTYMMKLATLIKTNRIQTINHIHLYYPGVFKDNKLLLEDAETREQYKLLTTDLVRRFVRMAKNYVFIDILSEYPAICNLRNMNDTFVITPKLHNLFNKLGFAREGVLPYYECDYCKMREYCPSGVWVCRNCQKCVGHLHCICNNNEGTAPIECDCAYFS